MILAIPSDAKGGNRDFQNRGARRWEIGRPDWTNEALGEEDLTSTTEPIQWFHSGSFLAREFGSGLGWKKENAVIALQRNGPV